MKNIVNHYNTLNAANNVIKARPIYTNFRRYKFKHNYNAIKQLMGAI